VAVEREVALKITADAAGVKSGVAVAQNALRGLQTQVGALESASARAFSFSGLAGLGLSATAAAGALAASVRTAADYGDQLDNMAQRTGVAVEELSRLQYAAKLSDTSTEALGKGISYLSKLMVGAASGGAESGKMFEKFNIELRNADGTMRSTSDVLFELADVFAAMPDGPEKTALAVDFFGKKLGTELIPLLNAGSAGLREMGDEAERLGLVIGAEQAKAAAQFNDNLDRLGQLSKSVGVNIGNQLIPWLNRMIGEMDAASKSSDGFLVTFLKWPLGLSEVQKTRDAEKNIASLTARIDALRARIKTGTPENIYGNLVGTDDLKRLEKLESERAELIALSNKKIAKDDEDTSTKRANIAANLAREQEKLEKLRAIASGEANADILKDDKARVAEQIKDAEKLRGALASAWETSRKEAQKAADDAQKLLEKAAGVRTTAADKAADIRNKDLPEEERQAIAQAQADELLGQGSFAAAAAGAALLDGRTKQFEQYQKQAEQFLDRAMKFAEAAQNADTIEAVGGAQAALIETGAKAKQKEAAGLEAQATAQADLIKKLDEDITALKLKAANIEIKADIAQAEGAVAALQKQLDGLVDKTVTVTMQTVSADINSAGLGEFAYGGWTGRGGKFQPAGIVHANEFVTRSEIVSQPGALAFLSRFNREGMRALRGYADGGLVSRMAIPVPSSATAAGGSGRNLTLVLGGERYGVSANNDVIGRLSDHVAREALRKGGR
jgi:hypothetical protein